VPFQNQFLERISPNTKEVSKQSVKNTALSMPIRHGNTKEAKYRARRKITIPP